MASKSEKSDALHKVTVTNGAVGLLTQVLPTMQWYKDQPMKIGLAGNDLNEALSAVKGPNADLTAEELAKKSPEEQRSIAAEQEAWADETYVLEMNENEREAAKACVQFFYKQGAFNLTKHVACLCRQLGLDV